MRGNTKAAIGLATGTIALGLLGAMTAPAVQAAPAGGDTTTVAAHPKHDKHRGKVLVRTLNVRKKATTHSETVGHVHKGDIVKLKCKVKGQKVKGNHIWYLLDKHHDKHHGWVSARYVKNLDYIPWCRY
ncbi:SH3 domain-containing protein [Streptomyces sp. CC77]|uniref:SH3 domain-containing protein n=1 Tax=Streptomyces sp. CC77 TaxID=1906739 RepID=UPI0008DC622D|nr:SH3 domain-containing protein [Streptomyces sp. CC77]OII69067.1 hypothetical protein BJP39_18845 [Streptomyces sp. CC77]